MKMKNKKKHRRERRKKSFLAAGVTGGATAEQDFLIIILNMLKEAKFDFLQQQESLEAAFINIQHTVGKTQSAF